MKQRLIDANALKEWFPDNGEGSWTYNVTVKACIDAQPTIDAVPLDGSFLKMSKGDYLIYDRHWLYEHFDQEIDIQRSAMKSMGYEPALKDAQPEEVIPHRNYKYLSDYWCECGWHLGKKDEVKYCAECGRKVNWNG